MISFEYYEYYILRLLVFEWYVWALISIPYRLANSKYSKQQYPAMYGTMYLCIYILLLGLFDSVLSCWKIVVWWFPYLSYFQFTDKGLSKFKMITSLMCEAFQGLFKMILLSSFCICTTLFKCSKSRCIETISKR